MTTEEQNQHEQARLRALIKQECQALKQGLPGLTGDARHAFVGSRMKIISAYADHLMVLLSEHAEVLALVVEALADADSDDRPMFLFVGTTLIAVAHRVAAHHEDDSSVRISTTSNETYTFHDEQARRFMELFKEHCQIGASTEPSMENPKNR